MTSVEPQVDLPPTASGEGTHGDLVAEAMAEAERNARLGELGEGDFTSAQLREALGDAAEGLSDDELMAEWQKAQAAGAKPEDGSEEEEKPEATSEPVKLEGFKLYDAQGNEIVDPTKVSALDLLTGKVQIGYNALSKEQRKNLRDLTRVASLGHYNEQKMTTVLAERQQAMQRAHEASQKITQYEADRRVWDQALTALVNGNGEPMQRLALAYQQALQSMPNQPLAAPTADQDAEFSAAGQQFFSETIVPRAQELATQYGANAIEIAQYIVHMCEQEGEFLTREKIDAILQYEMPAILEQNGYAAGAAAPASNGADPRDAEIAKLKAQVQEILATQKNNSTQNIRTKGKKAPPSGRGVPPATITVPEMTSRQDMLKYLRDD